ncbi:DUF3108 domain-containing protein [Thioalkalivibrio sp. ALJ24]|uniref:DUF3108 domain-containing protein n=1 Tax=Thioalkalivibrio sp. ALJ24 TaxID=545276 RepID=UPI00036AF745
MPQVKRPDPSRRFSAAPILTACVFALAMLLAAPAATLASDDSSRIPAFTASFEARAMGSTLKASMSLNHEDVRSRMAMDAHVTGLLRVLGRFELSRESLLNTNSSGLHLVSSRSHQVTPRDEREVETRLDHEEQMAIGHINGERFDAEVPKDTLDFLGSLYAIMQQLEDGELEATGDTTTIRTLERDRLREYEFRRDGEETVDSGIGSLETVRLVRRSDGSDVELAAWFAPALSHLPVRFDYEAGGRVFELELTALEWHEPIIDLTEDPNP